MEEMNRTHKEPTWGWIGALLMAAPRAARPVARPGWWIVRRVTS